jgi:hypothetical protein
MENTPWSTLLLEKLIVTQIIMTFPAFNGTRRFSTVGLEVLTAVI